MSRLGLYGGSFNPVHLGHVGIARRAVEDLSLDALFVIPAAVSPFKTAAVSRTEGLWDRIQRVQAAFRDVEKATVDLREIRRGGVSYAIDTVREIAAEHPGDELFFIVGEDSLEGLPRWKDAAELSRLCTFKAYPRTRESSTEIRSLFESAGVRLNPDEKLVRAVSEGIVRKGGYCPCRLPKLPEFFCPCEEFKRQLADSSFQGLCHCRLYEKPAAVKAVVSLGSNVEPRADFLKRALEALSVLPATRLCAASPVEETEPVGVPPEFQDLKFLNQVAIFETRLSADEFSRQMHAIEDKLGRVRTVKNAPRTIDLDLIDFGGQVVNRPDLVLPHPRAAERDFVMRPWRALIKVLTRGASV